VADGDQHPAADGRDPSLVCIRTSSNAQLGQASVV